MDAIQIQEEVEIILGRDIATKDVFLVYRREQMNLIIGQTRGSVMMRHQIPHQGHIAKRPDRTGSGLNQTMNSL